MILPALLAAPLLLLPIEFCSPAPEPPATQPPEWHWRMVDGRKCYFRSNRLLPADQLLWSFDAKQFDADEGATVKGQRHYTPQELKGTAAIEQRRRRGDQSVPMRKKMRARQKRDSADDD